MTVIYDGLLLIFRHLSVVGEVVQSVYEIFNRREVLG